MYRAESKAALIRMYMRANPPIDEADFSRVRARTAIRRLNLKGVNEGREGGRG